MLQYPQVMKMSKKKKKLLIILSAVLAVVISLVSLVAWGNKAIELNHITIGSEKLPEAFDGFRIAHVSDLHNDEFGKDNKKLIKIIESAEPDIIAVTGDLIDSYTTDVEIALSFMKQAQQIAPCYYVNGNHESRVIGDYQLLKEGLEEIGVVVLENATLPLEKDGECIQLTGVSDPGFETDYLYGDTEGVMRNHLEELIGDNDKFNLLLSHRPELLDVYAEYDIDLVLSGHAHGGQFRLPFVGGLYAPNQGLMPEIDAGLYIKENTNLIVSRGIGNSLFPFRLNNRPEVIAVTLEKI